MFALIMKNELKNVFKQNSYIRNKFSFVFGVVRMQLLNAFLERFHAL